MTAPPRPEDLPTLPDELSDRLLAMLFGDPARREAVFADLLVAYPTQVAALQAHYRHHVELEAGGEVNAAAGDTSSIPGYRLLAPLGEGGMGTVYRAEQLRPVHRLVALKVIKPGMDSKAVLARFEQERQALAAMDHDAIAKVFDCGTTARGQPFFAMELVEGLPIHRYCDEHRLSLRDRLALFAQVCRGVQHAHQKGVVHRDLKPGNVLVVGQQGQHAVKIIDFGVARAMDRSLAKGSLFTEQGMVVGTPEYMSPEQAAGNVARVDTRTDVYSLGVILYELLVGELPFPSAELRAAAFAEVQRRLLEDEPPKPSMRLSTGGAAATECAARRGLGADALRRELAGDLDWVVLKAMAKEPERRYESATALADDVQRYLAHEPLVAGPPSAGYRLRKFVRRHRGRVAAGAAVFATAVVGAVVALQFALREQAKVREFDLLSGVVLYERAVEAEKELYPPWPNKIAGMETWLREDCGRLLVMKPVIEQTLEQLRDRALLVTEEERIKARRSHPEFSKYERLVRVCEVLRRRNAIRGGRQTLDLQQLPAEQRDLDSDQLVRMAWMRVAPTPRERTILGEEGIGLLLAKEAVAKASGHPREHEHLATLAWALFANGQDAAARAASVDALANSPDVDREQCEQMQRDLEAAIAKADAELAAVEREMALVEATLDRRTRLLFAAESERFLHDEMTALLAKLAELEMVEKDVRERLRWAGQLAALTASHPNAKCTWDEAISAIAKSDDVVASKLYGSMRLELQREDMVGLVPIGMNPVSKLWEFYDLRSAWDGTMDPRDLPVPELDSATGRIEVGDGTGLVFVLIPGGSFTMGSVHVGDDADPDVQPTEVPRHEVEVGPFLLSRYEMTQGQWVRCGGRNTSYYAPGSTPRAVRVTLHNPVEQVSWEDCRILLPRLGLELPSEAQWEYACRGGSETVFWTGNEASTLMGAENIADEGSSPVYGREWSFEPGFDDGHGAHAPVGSFRPNPWGLHDMAGNVQEWCRDRFANYADGPVRRSESAGELSHFVVFRGGSFSDASGGSRSARRGRVPADYRHIAIGLRPVRRLQLP